MFHGVGKMFHDVDKIVDKKRLFELRIENLELSFFEYKYLIVSCLHAIGPNE